MWMGPVDGEHVTTHAAGERPGSGTLSIDLNALVENWRRLDAATGEAATGAVVKADAYGLGMEPVARALSAAGCDTFFVALPQEGVALRQALPEAVIYVFNGVPPGAAPLFGEHALRPVLNSWDEAREWAAYCRTCETRLPAAVHIDTGMNRLGMSAEEVERLAAGGEVLGAFRLALVMSHLACADEPGCEMNARQMRRFHELRAGLPDAPASLANSAGCFLGPDYTCDVARPGIALYGGNPFSASSRPNPMLPVVSLHAPIVQLRSIAAGESVGYGATWVARRDSRIATVGVGYADGFPRAAGGGGAQVMAGGQYAPVVGRVSMDTLCIDVTDIAPERIARGMHVEVLGPHIGIDELARAGGTIGYEILTRLGRRFTRLYTS